MGLIKRLKVRFRRAKGKRKVNVKLNPLLCGEKGEREVNAKLNPLFFGKVEHKQINNLILLDDLGNSHQIDHIEIRENGIFCIETKNYSGWIFGDENSKNWTQTIYREKHQFLNPLIQNKSHVYYVSKVLGRKYRVNSLVVMVQNNADRINVDNVINLKDLKSYLKNFNDGTNLSLEEMEFVYQKLLDASSKISNREHVKNIQKTQKQLGQGVCPRCNGKLVKRSGKYGEFWGCENYPKCKFTKNSK